MYLVNEPITGSVEVRDSGGDLANATSVAVTVTAPDGTTTTPTAGNPATGIYTYAFTPSQVGRYTVFVNAAGTNDQAFVPHQYDVWPITQKLIISLDDARAGLNLPAADTSSDEELQLYIAGATVVIEDIIGRVLAETVTETFDGGKSAILLKARPASITEVTESGTTITDYTADLSAGIIYRGSQTAPSRFAAGRQNVVVEYVEGGSEVAPNIRLAARTLIQHAYATTQQAIHPTFDEAVEDLAPTPSGWLVPRQVIGWLTPNSAASMPGLA